MASKTISNNEWGFVGLFVFFIGQAILGGLVIIALGVTRTLDPFVLTSYKYGLVIEGLVVTVAGVLGGLLMPIILGLMIKDPIRFIIDEDYIEAVQFGGLIMKSSSFVERHPREEITSIELSEIVRYREGEEYSVYTAKLLGTNGTVVGTLRGIHSTGVAEEIAETIKVELSRNF
tara:strand:+ start:460 stop:984 length:525 start_codon:yes stop_codon:yes gene_type:complete